MIEDYTGDFQKRMQELNSLLGGLDNLILVGSSFGGLMAAWFALENEPRSKKTDPARSALHLPSPLAVNNLPQTP